MDYKEEYQKALERAKKGLPIDEVFPELKESEDERIRKILIHIVKGACDKYGIKYKGDEITEEKLLAYLEKQKEVKWSPSECEMGVLYKLCYVSNQITDEDDTELTRLYQDLKREYFNGHSFENMFPKEKQKEQKLTECTSDSVLQKIKRAITSCRELSEHYKDTKENFYQYYGGKADGLQLALAYFGNKNELAEQKPAEWSEEDEKNIEKLDGFLSEVFCFGHVNVSQKDKEELQSWLKFLPERFNLQPKQEWSEEDEVMCEAILNTLERVGDYGTIGMQKDWLKSLKDRGVTLIPSSWKPSKEQMETLKNCAYGVFQNGDSPVLRELYNDIKKLYYE